MKISELMIKDIRAEIEVDGDLITIKNPKEEVKTELANFFKQQIDLKGQEGAATELEILELLIRKLTDLKIDTDDIYFIVENPSHEMTRVMFYLSSIMQELIFEVIASTNLEMRMNENTILEKDTLRTISKLEGIIEEIKFRRTVEVSDAETVETMSELYGKEV